MKDIIGVKVLLRTVAPSERALQQLKGKAVKLREIRALVLKGLEGKEVKLWQAGFYKMVRAIKEAKGVLYYETWLKS